MKHTDSNTETQRTTETERQSLGDRDQSKIGIQKNKDIKTKTQRLADAQLKYRRTSIDRHTDNVKEGKRGRQRHKQRKGDGAYHQRRFNGNRRSVEIAGAKESLAIHPMIHQRRAQPTKASPDLPLAHHPFHLWQLLPLME